ncbi:hypothetical protein JQ596_16885 [Bradyrhizobium manausense]|uniref:hypothetical protein n=1 Tax=Bradyrhizobium TaxID=374 RepID=UPI001BACFAC8|nr:MULTISPECIES: hypothetical protein [Bradyrhizobium]MBR0827208.1 hypothetical protein [Bradyrhizobium manausense]UVO33443.1 hypothetical protein KUF59_31695 [Bradyrhizobium arachidis]
MNFQVTVLKILVAYPDGFALMADLKRDMAILATSGRDWADRTKRLAARVPDFDIFAQGLIERKNGGWKITAKGHAVLEFMEARPLVDRAIETVPAEKVDAPVPPLPQLAEWPGGGLVKGRVRRRRARSSSAASLPRARRF